MSRREGEAHADATHGVPVGETALWVERAMRGEEWVFDRLERRFADLLLAFASLRIGRRFAGSIDPRDAVQEAWVSTWKLLEFFRPTRPGAFYGLLCRHCRFAIVNAVRKVRYQTEADFADSDKDGAAFSVERVPAPAPGPSDAEAAELVEVQNARVKALVAGLRELPPKDRELLVAIFIEHRPRSEIAQRLGLKINTFNRRVSRAREQLEGLVGRDVFGPERPPPNRPGSARP